MNDSNDKITLYDLPNQLKMAEAALFGAVRKAGGQGPSSLLGTTPRRVIQQALTSGPFFELHDGFRQSSTRETWKAFVLEASRKPKSLGFIRFEDGVPGLARTLRRDPATIWRNLETWSYGYRPLVIVDKMKEPGRKPSTYMIQIPQLTEWLLFTASMRAFKDSGMPNTVSWYQIRQMPELFTAIDAPAPVHGHPISYQETERLLRGAKTEEARRRHKPRRSR